MLEERLTTKASQTKALGKALAKTLLRQRSRRKALVIGLKGDLGGGKTTFLQGFAKGLRAKDRILSPTFIIVRRIKLDNCPIGQFNNFFHIDTYRLRDARDLLGLGFREIVASPKNVVAVEWADKVRKIMPRAAVWAEFDVIGKNKRKITIKDGK